ncbi:MAG: TatD family hydrolase [Lentisphaeria bacterium]|nr:TatD family hydrolase [Lentisphaeria bacterium]
MHFFDSHTHLPDDCSKEEAEAILLEASAASVKEILLAGTSLDDIPVYLPLAETHPGVHTAVGIHPEACSAFDEASALPRLREWAKAPGVVAIGEIGLDAHYDATTAEEQERCLKAMLRLADQTGLPVVIHCREAFERCHQIIDQCLAIDHPLQIHSFADGPRELDIWLKRNTFFSYNGMTTFKKAENIRGTLRLVPRKRLLLETDAPYLTPVPYRGQANASKFIPLIAERVAQEQGLSLEEVAELTTANAHRLFRLDK